MTIHSLENDDRLLELSELACTGMLSAEGFIQLDELLYDNRGNQKIYLEYVHLYSKLAEMAVDRESELKFLQSPRPRLQRIRMFAACLMIVCLPCLLIGLIYGFKSETQQLAKRVFERPGPIAIIQDHMHEAVWSVDGQLQNRSVRDKQRVSIDQGCLELQFENGTRLVAHAPADFYVDHSLCVRLNRGTLRATVAGEISGFKIVTENMEIVDHGTEFYVDCPEGGLTTSYVSQGSCSVSSKGRSNPDHSPLPLLVTAGECVLVDRDQELIPLNPVQSKAFCERMVSRFLSFDLKIQAMSPSVCLFVPDTPILDFSLSSVNRAIYLIPEKHHVILKEDLTLPDKHNGKMVIPAGTAVDSYIVHAAFGEPLPPGTTDLLVPRIRSQGFVKFQNAVIATIVNQEALLLTDSLFSRHQFPDLSQRVVESEDHCALHDESQYQVNFDFTSTENDCDHVRILVYSDREPPVMAPQ